VARQRVDGNRDPGQWVAALGEFDVRGLGIHIEFGDRPYDSRNVGFVEHLAKLDRIVISEADTSGRAVM
jgi:hypothetical protein